MNNPITLMKSLDWLFEHFGEFSRENFSSDRSHTFNLLTKQKKNVHVQQETKNVLDEKLNAELM